MNFRTTLVVATATLLPLGQASNAWAQAGLAAEAEGLGRSVPTEATAPVYERQRSAAFGVADATDYTLQAFAFAPFAASDGALFDANSYGSRFCTAACFFEAPVMIPSGASIELIELEACDTNASAQVSAKLFEIDNLEGGFPFIASVSTGAVATPGCDFFEDTLASPVTVDNFLQSYFVEVEVTGTDSTTRFQAVRISYRLQVSPAPATATFTDVPTGHPFFQFVEALVASGITGGCGGGNYCPNDPVTRGQMAVFLAAALGLHFPN